MTQDQMATVFNAAPANTTADSNTVKTETGILQGSIQLVPSATFNGTTSTAALQGSNDNNNWATVYADDGITPMTFTLAVGNNYIYELKRVLYKFYKIVYTKGDASTGTINANFVGK